MKAKKYWILTVVSLIAIVGSVIYASDKEKDSTEKAYKQQLSGLLRTIFMRAVYLTAFADSLPNITVCGNKDVLDGIEGVYVFVEPLPPEAEKYGLREQVFQTDTELRLRQHGIKVVTREERDSNHSKHNKQQVDFDVRMHEFTLYGEADMPSDIMDEPFKSLFECLKLFYEEGEEREAFGPKVLEREAECVKKFLEYGKQPLKSVMLYINVRPIILEEKGLGIVNVSVSARETVILERKRPLLCAGAITWQRNIIVTRGLSRMDGVRNVARDLVDQFINDYLAANSKEQPTTEAKKPKDD